MNTTLRPARSDELPATIALLADDPLGATRKSAGDAVAPSSEAAFPAIDADANHQLLVAELGGEIAGVLQLSCLPHLTREGGWRAQIEGVRVAAEHRSKGIGRILLAGAITRGRERGCHPVQLTTDRRRPEALRFYESLGFVASNEGMKLHMG